MQIDALFSTTINLLGKGIDLRTKQQNLISSNVANAETPNFTPKALAFEEELQGALRNSKKSRVTHITNPRHIPIKGASNLIDNVTGTVLETPSKTPGKDGNAVEIENEMSKMMENQIMYNASVQMLNKKFEGLRNAIREGK